METSAAWPYFFRMSIKTSTAPAPSISMVLVFMLEIAFAERAIWLPFINQSIREPAFLNDPRYSALRTRMGLPTAARQ